MNDITKRFTYVYNHLLDEKKIANSSSFAKKLEVSPSLLNEISKGRSNVGPTLLQNIVNNYPDINPEWLLTGKGNMLREGINNVQIGSGIQWAQGSHIQNNSNNRTNEDVVRHENEFGLNMQKFSVPVYDIEISADIAQKINDDNKTIPIAGHIAVSSVTGADCVVTNKGDSMSPRIKNGDLIAVKRITDLGIIAYGHIYLVITDDYTLVKYIRKGTSKETITLRSHNEYYEDIEMKISSIRYLFIVKNILSSEV